MLKKRKYSLLLAILCFFDMADVLLGIQKARESLFSSAAYKFCLVVLYRIQKKDVEGSRLGGLSRLRKHHIKKCCFLQYISFIKSNAVGIKI